MKANELRIGSIVQHNGEIIQVLDICEDGINQLIDWHEPEFKFNSGHKVIGPVPLTEEWLTKFGFHEIHDCMYYKYFNDLRIQLVNGPDWVVELTDSEMRESEIIGTSIRLFRICSHVHQIQNVFFSLTGKELTL